MATGETIMALISVFTRFIVSGFGPRFRGSICPASVAAIAPGLVAVRGHNRSTSPATPRTSFHPDMQTE
ncbi:MAG: hypothetical protein CR217_15520 [Beijerinckiaceae bacterium]|nr:MAG: hypothetical protein CR217_15520 [Beijerinckiaceae bacterium]